MKRQNWDWQEIKIDDGDGTKKDADDKLIQGNVKYGGLALGHILRMILDHLNVHIYDRRSFLIHRN
jgi:hypothetical protein